MKIETYASEIVTGICLVFALLLIIAAFFCSHEQAKMLGQQAKTSKTSVPKAKKAKTIMLNVFWCKTAERLCVGMACALFAVALLNINHSTTVDGICIIIQKLEALLRGR